MIKVHQAIDFCEAHDAAMLSEHAKIVDLWQAGRYEHVADVAHPDGIADTSLLEDAYRWTNNIDRAWWENRFVTKLIDRPCRSTSVGDVLQLDDGRCFVVAMCGFDRIKLHPPGQAR